ncbi:MAG TPA: quinoprotein dehydrogenase-associated putative ABC transporter substrate-binding protein [Rhodanobacteraceae bacterium]|jgi:quinoprotein dehydrogenase-associated probable ABC transporter substrate-binding protein|nr:quinoprotein dehydrogenase-associated putative ABC transporter substrate-binding protein [Rhodanobacteraceae bacterium]
MNMMLRTTLLLGFVASACAAAEDHEKLTSFTVCADPGNMPLSNKKGEGFQNKIAEVLGETLGTGVQYRWHPSFERALMRTTIGEGNCDLWMDMASDTDGAEMTTPLYRSAFVLVYREDSGIIIKSFDDPALQRGRIGVYQVSAIRQALAAHGVMQNTVIQYLSHDGDIVPEDQPSYSVQQVVDKKIEMAAVWGPMAGWYKAVKKAPLVIQPVNLMDDTVPLEFDMAMATPRGRPEVKVAVEKAMRDSKDKIQAILVEYGVPLVKCEDCIINGDLASHGPYKPISAAVQTADTEPKTNLDDLKKWLAQGADPNAELGNAVIANDVERVRYLVEHGADASARDGDGYTALGNAVRFSHAPIAALLLEHKADPNATDLSGWTPLMYASWADDADLAQVLIAHGARHDVTKEESGLTPLAIAAQNGKPKAAAVLIDAGADVNHPVGQGSYTPLMLATTSGSADIAERLVKKGADVNAKNPGGVTALMIAAAGNRSDIATLLIHAGADATIKSEDGRTALTIAQANNSDAVAKLLKQQPAQKPGRKST